MGRAKPEYIRSQLAQCFCTSAYHATLSQAVLTDGTLLMAQLCHAFWLLDIIISHQRIEKVQRKGFQVWKLILCQDSEGGKVICTDGNDNFLAEQELDYTDFPLLEGITLWKEGDVILLPSEH
jgi:hypothetical protein